MPKMIISVIGPDRPGIIAAVTKILFENDGNIENVSQTIMQSQFSGTFIVTLPDHLGQTTLTGLLKEGLRPMGLHVHLHLIDEGPGPAGTRFEHAQRFVITTQGPDQKGLVAKITAVIAHFGVNVTNLQAIFKGGDDPTDNVMIYEVDIPLETNQPALRRALKEKADELNLDINIQHRNIFEAIHRV